MGYSKASRVLVIYQPGNLGARAPAVLRTRNEFGERSTMGSEYRPSRGFHDGTVSRYSSRTEVEQQIRHTAHGRYDGNNRLDSVMPFEDRRGLTHCPRVANRRATELHDLRHMNEHSL